MRPIKTAEELRELCTAIEQRLIDFKKNNDLSYLVWIVSVLRKLREVYHSNPTIFGSYTDTLKRYREEIRSFLRSEEQALVARYGDLVTEERKVALLKELYRDSFIELCEMSSDQKVALGDGSVIGNRHVSLRLPKIDSRERSELVQFLKENTLWDRFSAPSANLLRTAVQKKTLKEDQLDRIRTLCSVQDTYRISFKMLQNEKSSER